MPRMGATAKDSKLQGHFRKGQCYLFNLYLFTYVSSFCPRDRRRTISD